MSGTIYSDSLSVTVLYPYGFDYKTYLFNNITADNEYHYFSKWIIINSGTVESDIDLYFEGEPVLFKSNETGHITQNLSIGEIKTINDISLIISINKNSSDAKDKIIISQENFGKTLPLIDSLSPGNNVTLFFYVKNNNGTISGKYETLFETHIITLAANPFYNPDFRLLNMDENEFRFNLDFYLILTNDAKIGDIVISYPKDITLKPNLFSPVDKNTSEYEIKIPINLNKVVNTLYPYDTYNETIKIDAVNDSHTKYIISSLKQFDKKEIKTEKYIFTITTTNNLIYLKLERNQEKTIFIILLFIGILIFVLRLVYIFRIKKYSLSRKLDNFIFYFGSSISIPFYFGVIFNWILFISPSQFIISFNIVLIIILISCIILDAYSNIIKEEIKENIIEKLWKRKLKKMEKILKK